MAVHHLGADADRTEATSPEVPDMLGDALTVPDYTPADAAGSDGDGLSVSTSGRSGAIRLDESSDTQPGTGVNVSSFREAARLAVAAHREAADEHLQAETDWRAALSGPDWQQHQERYTAAVRRVTLTRHTALAALGRLAAADLAECEELCGTSELQVAVRADGGTG